MAKNQVIDPRDDFALSWPIGSADATDLPAGTPVMAGDMVGVTLTTAETKDGGATGVVNSNAPGNVTVWSGGLWRLPVKVVSTAGVFGATVYAVPTSDKIAVTLQVTANPTKDAGWRPYGVLIEPSGTTSASTADLVVKVRDFAGPVVVTDQTAQ